MGYPNLSKNGVYWVLIGILFWNLAWGILNKIKKIGEKKFFFLSKLKKEGLGDPN